MTILLSRIVPREQMVVVHAPLAEVEWAGAVEHVENTLPDGVPLILAPVTSGKSLLDSIEERGRFPSPSVRWCTSSTKRGPIERELRRYLRSHPQFGGRLVNAMGMRAEESAARARKLPWKRSDRNSKAGGGPGTTGFRSSISPRPKSSTSSAPPASHRIRPTGWECRGCPACSASWPRAPICAPLQPALYRRYVRLEQRIGHTLSPTGVPLPALTGVPVELDPGARRCERSAFPLA